jgi:hypothetical protein
MKLLTVLVFLFLLPFSISAHPGIGIVRDSKGNIYYTDLEQVWKISNGIRSIAVPHVHTHELYIDAADNLYGEHVSTVSDYVFDHYLWVLKGNGDLDTVIEKTRAYQRNDYSLARDASGNEYYVKQFYSTGDTQHIYRRTPEGKETIFSTGNVNRVSWLHPQADGSLLYVKSNHLYLALGGDTAKLLASNIGSAEPRMKGWNSPSTYGCWKDDKGNIYVAVFTDEAIKKISPDGEMTEYYRAERNWGPTHGVFDKEGKLWVLECSNTNQIRVVEARQSGNTAEPIEREIPWTLIFISSSVAVITIVTLLLLRKRPAVS